MPYRFHEWSDFTAFPGPLAADVTLGLQHVQVQVIDIARRSLTRTTQTEIQQGEANNASVVVYGLQMSDKSSVKGFDLFSYIFRELVRTRSLYLPSTLGNIDSSKHGVEV